MAPAHTNADVRRNVWSEDASIQGGRNVRSFRTRFSLQHRHNVQTSISCTDLKLRCEIIMFAFGHPNTNVNETNSEKIYEL